MSLPQKDFSLNQPPARDQLPFRSQVPAAATTRQFTSCGRVCWMGRAFRPGFGPEIAKGVGPETPASDWIGWGRRQYICFAETGWEPGGPIRPPGKDGSGGFLTADSPKRRFSYRRFFGHRQTRGNGRLEIACFS